MPTIDSFHFSDPGQKRTNNEDASGSFEPTNARQLKQSGRLYVVADGLGGHEKGEKASRFAVDSLLKSYYEAPEVPPENRLRDIIQQVHQNLIAYAQKNVGPGGKVATTVVAAVVRENNLLVAHVGDSRAYLIRDGEVHQITRDHSFVGEMQRAGALTEEEARQSRYRNRLTRSVGGSESALEVDVSPPIPLLPGDLILLCTDGLTQYATREDLLAAASYGTPRQIVERLIRFANTRGGSDNITVSVIKYGKPSTSLPFSLPSWKVLAAIGAGALALLLIVLVGGYVLLKRPAAQAAPSFTLPPPMTSAVPLTEAPLLEPTQTLEPTPPPAPIPSETSTPPAPVMVDCDYLVKSGDIISEITVRFQITLSQIYLDDKVLIDPDSIQAGWTLTFKLIPEDICTAGGGTPLLPSAPAP